MFRSSRESWYETYDTMFETILKDPTNAANAEALLWHARDERLSRDPYHIYTPSDYIPVESYRMAVRGMLRAKTPEEQQVILASEVEILPQFRDYYQEFGEYTWYDITVGDMYKFHPEKVHPDPFGPYPQSVYECIGTTVEQINPNAKISLDLGSGQGNVSRILSPFSQEVVALDRFPVWHNVAKKRSPLRNIGNTQYLVADLSQGIPLADRSVDVVATNGLSVFIPPDKIEYWINEITRVLTPGGIFLEPELSTQGRWHDSYMKRIQRNPKSMLAFLMASITTADYLVDGKYPHSSKKMEKQLANNGYFITEYGSVSEGYWMGISTICFRAPR
jgi:ubiquinone/menaquinone biosynthesis C-methylase UbiE